MPDRIDRIVGIFTGIVGLAAVIKLAQRMYRSVVNGVLSGITERIDKQLALGKLRDLRIEELKSSLEEHLKERTKINASIMSLEKELRPNGGASIFDKINLILHTLENQSAKFLALHQDNPQGIFFSDLLGKCTWVNATLLRITGRSEDELLGWNWLNQLDEEDVVAVRVAWALAFSENREYKRIQTYITPTGAKIRTSVVARPVYAPNDAIIEWVGFVHLLP